MKYPPSIFIRAVTLPDAYGQAIEEILKKGMIIETQYGNISKDVCSMIEITRPFDQPMLHPDFPTKTAHTEEYLKQWFRGYDWLKQGFDYNYMDRLTHYPKSRLECDSDVLMELHKRGKSREGRYYNNSPDPDSNFIDQIAAIKDAINKGVSRRIQATTWVPDRDLFIKEDQPCLQRLWMRNLGNMNVELHVMWRSRDAYAAWNSNMIGLLAMVKNEILEPNALRLVKVIDFCNSLHIYAPDWDAAARVKRVAVNPMYVR
jgi:thymidylate synthase